MNEVTMNAIENMMNDLDGAISVSTLLDISTNERITPTPEVMHGSLAMIINRLKATKNNLNVIINQING